MCPIMCISGQKFERLVKQRKNIFLCTTGREEALSFMDNNDNNNNKPNLDRKTKKIQI